MARQTGGIPQLAQAMSAMIDELSFHLSVVWQEGRAQHSRKSAVRTQVN